MSIILSNGLFQVQKDYNCKKSTGRADKGRKAKRCCREKKQTSQTKIGITPRHAHGQGKQFIRNPFFSTLSTSGIAAVKGGHSAQQAQSNIVKFRSSEPLCAT